MIKPKIVIDTNVFISAAFLNGEASLLMEKWNENKFVLLFSPEIFDEYFEVIARPKFNQQEKNIRVLADLLIEKGVSVEPKIKLNIIKNDPDDNKFLECAAAGKANFIISGDKHLLALKNYKTIKIIQINQFIKDIESRQ